ncbi:SRPBCC family protein [Streptosporangium longisporum]|uniref:SRPBCC family protein n=1 Tax=Streptosporangium longisporum TaxID=46187 RepID=UPI0031F0082E
MECRTERSDTYSVSIEAPPEFVWRVVSDVEGWPRFSPFALAVERTSETTYDVTGPQGPVVLSSLFHRELLLLDHKVILPDGTEVLIPYRVTANHRGSELIMTNVKSPGDSAEEYAEQLEWMRAELDGAKKHVEELYRA